MPALRDVFTPLIAYTLFLGGSPAERSRPFAEVRADIERLVEQQRVWVKRDEIAPQDYQEACFAVIAWVDEAIMRCTHDSNPDLFAAWRRAPLQVELFATANAGEEFFERLARLTPAQSQVIELYHLALCLGFRGRYYDESREAQLVELRRQYAAHLPTPLLDPLDFERRQEHITPQPYAISQPAAKLPVNRPSPYWLALPVLAGAALVLYFLWPRGPNPLLVKNAVRGFDCASINVAGIDKGAVALSGHVVSDEERDEVRRKVLSVRRVTAVSDDFTVIPRPFCEVMEVLGPFKDMSDKQGFTLAINPSKGCNSTYYKGENLAVNITATKVLHYVYVDYYVADREMVAHLLPNPQEPDNALDNSPSLTVGAANDKAQWLIQPPFGREMVTVISSPKPLFSPPRLEPETASDYLLSLRKALAAEAANSDLAAAWCFTISADR
jgi:type IV/VI secretion system ImpK/VasF family protein